MEGEGGVVRRGRDNTSSLINNLLGAALQM